MKPEFTQLASLSAVIAHDLIVIDKLNNQLNQLLNELQVPEPTFSTRAAAAYVLHNIYNALENTFEQISRTFENHIVDQAKWHKELMDKMFLEIPSVRPAIFPETLRKLLNDLRGFRHVFRHSYDFDIDPILLLRLVEHWQHQKAELIEALKTFHQSLLSLLLT